MSFRCAQCKLPQPAHAKPVRIVVERYSESVKTDDGVVELPYSVRGQIKKEVDICSSCAGLSSPVQSRS